MQILALLSNRDDVMVPHIKGALRKYTVYPLKTMEEVKDLYSNIPLNLLLIDTVSHSLLHRRRSTSIQRTPFQKAFLTAWI
ncbi:MAG: hypothetical protein AMK71_04335 [Nitrospira bacterium SG8_35_4]|nr:MAG: hypothetical protein AMK71_04335 [Nitrospira bacterium SG8_35_4]